MNGRRWYPTRIPAQIPWNENFYTKIPGYETILDLPPAHVDACVASLKFTNYVLGNWLNDVRAIGPAATAAVDLLLYGSGPSPVVLPTFTLAPLPEGVASVPPGSLNRLFDLVAIAKRSPAMTDIIARDLLILGPDAPDVDLSNAKPDFKLALRAGQPFVDWKWGGLRGHVTGIELRVSRGAGLAPVFLTIDSVPGYQDTEPVPATPAKWTYEGIWRLDDQRVGLWSNPVSITVGG